MYVKTYFFPLDSTDSFCVQSFESQSIRIDLRLCKSEQSLFGQISLNNPGSHLFSCDPVLVKLYSGFIF